MEDAAFETGSTDHEPPDWAIDAAKGELSDDASEEEIRTRRPNGPAGEGCLKGPPQPRRRTMDAMSLLKEDHRRVTKMLAELESTTERGVKTREELFARVKRELVVHEAIEEEIFYPALKEHPKTKDIALEAYEEHHVVDTVMAEIEGVAYDDETWGAKFKVMKENLEHHIEEEEGEMFKQARQVFDQDELAQLGESMKARKEDLIRQQAATR
jgi:hemerythrin-like domain-containing protein